MAIPTPPTPTGEQVYEITLPADDVWIRIVLDNLAYLTKQYAWEQSSGGITPLDAASYISEALESVVPK